MPLSYWQCITTSLKTSIMRFFKSPILLLYALFLIFCAGCQGTNSKTSADLSNIDLLRGDIALCGDPEFGELSFTISCKNSSRETFNLAVSLLHSFEYDEAEKTFVKIIDADPDCAMAYWGVAMSIYHALWFAPSDIELEKGAKVLMVAESAPRTSREQEYLDAIGAFYDDWEKLDHATRALKVEKKMGELYENHPDDTEAAIFYALALKSTADRSDMTYANQRKAGKILESLFPDQPDHPGIAHYIIHNYDNPELAPLALPTARRYAEIAPASAHAQHMPSHIFTRLGLWQESINTNLNSAGSAVCYAEAVNMEGHWDQEIHAIDYLVYAYLQQGDNARAREQLDYLTGMRKMSSDLTVVAYPLAAIPARMALENKDWSQAANLELSAIEFAWEEHPWEKSILHFAKALGASHMGDINQAQLDIASLEALHQQLVELDEIYSVNQVMIQIKAARAWLYYAQGNHEEALVLMQESSDMEELTTKHPVTPGEVLPSSELLGDMLMALNRPEEALKAYQIDLRGHPNRFNGVYGAATASKALGDQAKAVMYFDMLIALDAASISTRSELDEARQFLLTSSIGSL